MSFMDLITGATINRGVDKWRATDGAVASRGREAVKRSRF